MATTEARVAGCRAHNRHPQTLNGELEANFLEVGFARSKAAQLGGLGEGVVSVRMGDWIVGWR